LRSFCAGDRIIDPGQLATLLANFDDLPTIPDILFQILRILDDPDSGANELADVVRLDAPLTTRILRLANSPYYSARGDMADIQRCISVLGYRTIRQVAICVSVATSLVSAAGQAQGQLDYRELWRHSVATGAIAKQLAQVTNHPDCEEVFTAGLLHDLGKYVFEIHFPATYGKVIASRTGQGQTLVEAEREAFGFDHAVLGEAFGFYWRFPTVLTTCAGHHHDPLSAAGATERPQQALALVALADFLANTLDPTRCDLGFDSAAVNGPDLMAKCGLTPEDVSAEEDAFHEAVRQSAIFLDLH
jgi:HD-like signal output (HDOD) protein